MEVDDIDAVKQILAESLFLDHRAKVCIGGTDHTYIRPACLTVAQHFVGLVLQHTQQLHLAGQRQFANLVEEDGAALGQFETAYAVGLGISKRPYRSHQ